MYRFLKLFLFFATVWAVQLLPAVAESIQYADIQEPTAERPYYLATFDTQTLREHPDWTPGTIEGLHEDKLVILNFVREGDEVSALQTQVLVDSVEAAAAQSQFKPLMLVNISVADAEGRPVYAAEYQAYYERNTLADGNRYLDLGLVPYGVIYGTDEVKQDGNGMFTVLSDFAIFQDVKTEADVRENIQYIQGSVLAPILGYNRIYGG